MFSDHPYDCFDKYPKHEAKPSTLCLPFPIIIEIVERLLHGLAKPLSEDSWIESKEFFVESRHRVLVIRHIWLLVT